MALSMIQWSLAFAVLIGFTASAIYMFGLRPSMWWDFCFFAFAGTVVLMLLLHVQPDTGAIKGTWAVGGVLIGGLAAVVVSSPRGRHWSTRRREYVRAIIRANLPRVSRANKSRSKGDNRGSGGTVPYWLVGVAGLVVIATFIAMTYDRYSVTGEPFPAPGISMWPVTLARSVLFGAACTFIVLTFDMLGKNSVRLREEFLGQGTSLRAVPQEWRCFFRRRFVVGNTRSAMPMVWIYFLGAFVFFLVTGFPSNPSRGQLCFMTSQVVMSCTVIAMMLLSFIVFEAVQGARSCVKGLKKQLDSEGVTCPDEMLTSHAQQWRVSLAGELRPAIEGLAIVRLLAEHTRTVGRLLLLPAWIVLGTALIRLSWMDNLGVSWQLLLVLSILVVFPLVFYGRLRQEVNRIRELINNRLQQLRVSLTAGKRDVELRQLAILNDAINAESRGAFAPIARDPIFQALSIPFGGAGGVMLIQDLMSHL